MDLPGCSLNESATRRLALLVAALLGPTAVGCTQQPDPASARPAVVLVSIDTLRSDHLGCYGYLKPTSPEIDRFRREAVLMQLAIAQAPSTLASHASMLTSLPPQHHGASVERQSALRPGVKTLAGLLRAAGFATASFNGGGQLDRSFGLDRGFETYVSATDGSTADVGDDTLTQQVAKATDWLDRSGGRPFFLFVHTYEVHHPYTPSPERLRQMDAGYQGNLPGRISIALLQKINAGERKLAPGDLEHVEAAYDAEIASADAAFGQLLQALRNRGLYDSALVVLTSDHGEAFGEHGNVGWHGDELYDEQVHIPLIVKLPHSRLGGRTIENQVREIDLAPTVLSLLNLPVPIEFGGSAIDLAGGAPSHPPWAVIGFDGRIKDAAVRTRYWKWYDGRLYDLVHDPHEMHDLSRSAPSIERDLQNRLAAILQSRELAPTTPVPIVGNLREHLRGLGYVPSGD